MSNNRGVLVVAVGDDQTIINAFHEDVWILSSFAAEIEAVIVKSQLDLLPAIESRKPRVLHLLAKVDSNGNVAGVSEFSLRLSHLIERCHQVGVMQCFLASENDMSHMIDELGTLHDIEMLLVTHRNRHFSAFFSALIEGMSKGIPLAVTYARLAPQHQIAQEGLPLPGTIAFCNAKEGPGLVLWTNPQE